MRAEYKHKEGGTISKVKRKSLHIVCNFHAHGKSHMFRKQLTEFGRLHRTNAGRAAQLVCSTCRNIYNGSCEVAFTVRRAQLRGGCASPNAESARLFNAKTCWLTFALRAVEERTCIVDGRSIRCLCLQMLKAVCERSYGSHSALEGQNLLDSLKNPA